MKMLIMDYKLAMSAGQTAADLQMRREGRSKWNLKDRNRAAEVFWQCYGNDALEAIRKGESR